jgi:hypothetical protein
VKNKCDNKQGTLKVLKLDNLLKKEVTRKQFITTVALGAVSLFGLSSVMGVLTQSDSSSNGEVDYGMQNYGK